jgi:glycosyltransferase involved in cell wall biosynthesis
MRFLNLTDLPPPPPGKTGFPWTEASQLLPGTMPDGAQFPRVSIVTPSYNQAQYIEETIRSVLLQGYPNLEYFVMDGGSTDGSVEIIRKYARWLTGWVSERDQGQVHAVDKGWKQCSGEIIAYLNSDDTYLPNAIGKAVGALAANPDAAAICGGELWIDSEGMVIYERRTKSATLDDLLHLRFIPQPAIFLRRTAFERAGALNLDYQFSFDFELWTRVLQHGEIRCIPEILAATRWHSDAKTLARRPQVILETRQVIEGVLAGSAGSKIPKSEKRVIKSLLYRLAASIYIDNFSTHGWKALANTFAAAIQWYPSIPSMIYLFGYKVLHPNAILSLPSLKPTATHWSRWQPASIANGNRLTWKRS